MVLNLTLFRDFVGNLKSTRILYYHNNMVEHRKFLYFLKYDARVKFNSAVSNLLMFKY